MRFSQLNIFTLIYINELYIIFKTLYLLVLVINYSLIIQHLTNRFNKTPNNGGLQLKYLFNKKHLSRKIFIRDCLTCTLGLTSLSMLKLADNLNAKSTDKLHKADYWKSLPGGITKCMLCPNGCELSSGETGLCHARGNYDGTMYSLVYNKPAVIAMDNIEKTPLYHYQLKEKVFSIATAGCNLSCKFCQNWKYSQAGPDEAPKQFYLTPEDVIKKAKKHGVDGINFFYTDPVVYYEYMRDIAKLAKQNNLKTFCITAGYINRKPLEDIIPYIDAFAVGLKGFTNTFYREYIDGELSVIKDTLKILNKHRGKTWYEIVNLIVPGLNDNPKSIKAMTAWIKTNLGKDVPLHFTKFEPYYKLKNLPPTPRKTLVRAHKIAKKTGLNYVYIGNIPGEKAAHTYCPACGNKVIERLNFLVIKNNLKNGRCKCGHKLPGQWIG